MHAFRVTFATLMATAGVPLQTAQAAMRHSDPRLTANTYTDPHLLDVHGAVESIAMRAGGAHEVHDGLEEHRIAAGPKTAWTAPKRPIRARSQTLAGGEGGIRTLGILLGFTALAMRRIRPLCHLSSEGGGGYRRGGIGASVRDLGGKPRFNGRLTFAGRKIDHGFTDSRGRTAT